MLTLFLIIFVDLVGFGLVIPLLPFYGEYFQATPAEVGLLMASYSAAQFLSAPFWGRLSDRVGRKPVLMISLAGIAVAYVWLAFAEHLWMLFAARAFAGAMAGNIAVAFACAADLTEPGNRARGMGLIGAAFGLGFIFGPAIGGMLAGDDPANADYRTPALVAATLSCIALAMTFLALKETISPEVRERLRAMPPQSRWRQFRQSLTQPAVLVLIGLSFLAHFVFSGMETTFAMWSRRQFGWGPEQNGYIFAFIGVITAAIQGGLVGRLAKRFGEPRLILLGAATLTLGILLIPFSRDLPLLVMAMFIVACGFSLISPTLVSLTSLQVGIDNQGGTMGVSRSATTLARVLGPTWAGALFYFLGKDWPFFGGAIVMAVVVVLALRIGRWLSMSATATEASTTKTESS
ncbi:MAG: MFS transporter [Rhodospirillales bacterium]|nr:MFS transporter [Rhodospirillales bacterium]